MRYKRQESLRFEFGTPVECEFKITRVNDKQYNSKQGKALIHDISPGGLKISTEFDLHSSENKIEVEISFLLVSNKSIVGEIVWKKKKLNYFYGIDLLIDEESSQELIKELKTYSLREKNL
ncbi:PilZ domain-containing protein [Aquibacillus saliphilus]|uniref:PilZ domain-containing protein n=1 Tax=Aquibacillus saliphilus TaxID=1909422 RepID=UPI001CF0B7CA|nr:PilZ domain-containing protein [Aquibacillus saliphilus]